MELAAARVECLQSKGWDVSLNDDATFDASYPAERGPDYASDNVQCLNELGIDPDAPPSEKALRSAYEYSLEGAECLRQGGWPISGAPSFQTFTDEYENAPWYPWLEVPEGQLGEALKACPAPPPTL